MKKLILLAITVAALGFTSCGNDDDGGNPSCRTCSADGESSEVCEGENGNAIVDGEDSGIAFQDFIDLAELGGVTCN